MPRGDGTGPLGMGPKTGNGAGCCSGYDVVGPVNSWWKKGCFCRGGCFGRDGGAAEPGRNFRWQNRYNATKQPFWARGRHFLWNRPQAPGFPSSAGFSDKESEVEFLKREASALEEELNQIKTHIENLNKDS